MHTRVLQGWLSLAMRLLSSDCNLLHGGGLSFQPWEVKLGGSCGRLTFKQMGRKEAAAGATGAKACTAPFMVKASASPIVEREGCALLSLPCSLPPFSQSPVLTAVTIGAALIPIFTLV